MRSEQVVESVKPLMVHAGDSVRLWQRAANVRIEMTGVAEKGARIGDPIIVQVIRQADDEGQSIKRVSGTVRGVRDVEMQR